MRINVYVPFNCIDLEFFAFHSLHKCMSKKKCIAGGYRSFDFLLTVSTWELYYVLESLDLICFYKYRKGLSDKGDSFLFCNN